MSQIIQTDFFNRFTSNLFGSIAGGAIIPNSKGDFVPTGINGEVADLKEMKAQWLGLSNPVMQKYAYEFCYPVASVVDRLAEMDLNGELEILKAKGKGKDDYAKNDWAVKMNKLLAQPNPLQTWDQFRGQQNLYKRIFGYCISLPLVPEGFQPWDAVSIINLPPWLTTVNTGKISNPYMVSSVTDVIQSVSFQYGSSYVTIPADKIIIFEDSFMQDDRKGFALPLSKLVGLDMAISNICAAMEADNVLLKKRGPLGFISHDAAASKDAITGYLPMTKREKKEVQTVLNQYGLSWSQWQFAVTRQAVKWNPISWDVKQLGTKETVVAAEKAICHRFNFPYVLYEETDATYANGNQASKNVYINTIIPAANKDMAKYNKFFKAEENDCKIELCFDDIPALQEDKKMQAEAANSLTQTLEREWLNDIITRNQWLTARGYDTIDGGDIYYSQWKSSQPQQQTEVTNNQ